MGWKAPLIVLALVALLLGGCGDSEGMGSGHMNRDRMEGHGAAAAAEETGETEASECDPNYSGACLDPYASDYDCEGGSGNGPDYTGEVTVVGVDHYGLDADGDGIGCESY